jgi:hypothetical protein
MATRPDPEPRDLAAIQRFLGDAFRQFQPLTEREDLAPTVRAVVGGNDRLSPEEQAEIYREQFWLRHRDVLRDDFPALRHLIGDEAFDAFMRAYLLACPPDSYTLRDLGQRLADFAQRYEGFSPQLEGPARDMARFELAFVDIFDGPDHEPVDVVRVEAIAPEAWPTAVIQLQPMLTVLALDHPVHRYRSEVRKEGLGQDTATKDPAATDTAADEPPAVAVPERESCWVAMWRGADLRVHYRPVSAEEAALVEALRTGASLGQACADVASSLEPTERESFSARLGAWFQGWAKRGWIVDVQTES